MLYDQEPAGNDQGSDSSSGPTEHSFASPPAITLPKGGGAIRGIGEKFATNPVTGTGSLTVPIATSPGRSSFGPQLSLSYDSGSGNGPFGLGWTLSLPAITRKTDKGLPQYRDVEESDVYILSGAEDLVPILLSDGSQFEDDTTVPGYTIHRYRPRIEGLFARIERWTNRANGEIHWRSITGDNITTLYGKTTESRIADPADPARRIFSWLICESYDDKGNAIVYEYVAENDGKIDRTQVNERNRVRTANRYLKRIKYGNRVSRLVQPDLTQMQWMFEVVFDYDEGHYEEVDLDQNRPLAEQHRFAHASAAPDLAWDAAQRSWAIRPDPFSSYRAGFEVRTYRRCHRVLMFHHIPELGDEPRLVRAAEFDYVDLDYGPSPTIDDELAHQGSTRFASFIRTVTQSGFVRDDTQPVLERNGVRYVSYLKKSLPPLKFEYSQAKIQEEIRESDADSLENLPIGLDGTTYRWVDLDGEGLSGILTEQATGWFYKRNLSPINIVQTNGSERVEAQFAPLKQVASKPAASLTAGNTQLLDLAGDGQLDLVTLTDPVPGFYERTQDEEWKPFKAFVTLPNIPWDEPNLRFVDLNGDSHADVLITEQEVFTWYPSLAEAGFGSAQRVHQPFDEEQGPRLVFADGTQSIYLADMCGDGLTDLVRIRNGEVCYWPNLGYGHFGAKVTMDNAPRFDGSDQFDQQRIRLADIDGSGTNDIIYLGRDEVCIYFNQSGNRWSSSRVLTQFPHVDSLSSVMTADLLGNGTACLVWSSPLPGDTRCPMYYIDLMGQKPHLLIKSVNNLGAETQVKYAPSTMFYLKDKLAGKPWITRIPFPVHVVERVETYDRISGNRFVTRYAYHHGYFDGVEREFRGFGMVEQWDTEEFAALNASQTFPVGTNVQESSHIPPVLTRTWFHTGVYIGRDHVSDFFAGLMDKNDIGEYYREPGLSDPQAREHLLADTIIPPGLTVEEEREACRALKGLMLRQEVYALDAPDEPKHPYTITEQNFTIETIQGRGSNRHAVFFTHPREVINYHYERNPTDPRIAHNLTLQADEFGNVLKSVAIGYGRREKILAVDDNGVTQEIPNPGLIKLDPGDQTKQKQTLITYTENSFTNSIDEDDNYHTPLLCESQTYELTGAGLSDRTNRFRFGDWVDKDKDFELIQSTININYEETAYPSKKQKRLIEHIRTLYRRNNLAGPLPLGELQSLALPFESYKLAFTPGLVAEVYGGRVTDEMLEVDGRYVHSEGDTQRWIPSGQVFYSPDSEDLPYQELAYAQSHFFLPHRYRDPFHTDLAPTETLVTYDAYDLLVEETRDALDNRVTVGERDIDPTRPLVRHGQDYRVLQPTLIMDPNRNRSAVAFDALGMVAGTAMIGKPEENRGDSLSGFRSNLTDAVINTHLQNPLADPQAILRRATTRLVYDLFAYQRTKDQPEPQPAVVYTLARETHDADLAVDQDTVVQHSFSYSDGFGREIQQKIQAEPGPVPKRGANRKIIVGADNQPEMTQNDVSPRWVGSGWTVFNNKGKPVRQYEPFFTDTHRFEFDVRIGVSPVLFYDPVERVVATLHPNHTWEKVVFDPWRQETWDVNDTVKLEPQSDKDVKGFFVDPDGTERLPKNEYLPTWYDLRTDAAKALQAWPDADANGQPLPNNARRRAAEKRAAEKAQIHADTPTIAHFDSLGRTFLTIAHNKFKYSDTPQADPPTEEFYPTRVHLDIEGNQRQVVDAKDRLVMIYHYDMLGNRIHQASMEAGERWTLNDAAGNPVRTWDSRGHHFTTEYDQLRRPVRQYVRGTDATHSDPRTLNLSSDILFEQIEYGEGQPDDVALNLRTNVFKQYDGAGVVTNGAYDFKGNLLHSTRELAQDYKNIIDWSTAQPPGETFSSRTTYDALNRPTTLTTPDNSVIHPSYNEANLLERVEANLRGETTLGQLVWTPFVENIDYDTKGQRTRIDYATKNGKLISTRYIYDRETFRLIHLYTRRGVDSQTGQGVTFTGDCEGHPPPGATTAAPENPPGGKSCGLQNLHYTYDPVGNITHIRDDAQQTIFFKNKRVEPSNDYTYDAIYRLIEATGREHLGQNGGGNPLPPMPSSYNDRLHIRLPHPNQREAMGRYLERYIYDEVGNFAEMIHQGSDPVAPGWTRRYTYDENSQLGSGKSNRLTSTTVGTSPPEQYSTDGDGYDPHGNMLHMPHLHVMQWDFKDQLCITQQQAVNNEDEEGILKQGERTYYVYDASEQRVRKVTELATGNLKEERIYLGGFEIYRRQGVNALVRETLHIMDSPSETEDGNPQRIALVETRTDTPEPEQLIRYQFGNHLGSASLELTDHAQIISYEEYTPFGSTSYQAVRSQTETSKQYRYTAKERDEESGLFYYGARYYAPWFGVWISPDPAGFVDGSNLYRFLLNNPLSHRDLNGLQTTAEASNEAGGTLAFWDKENAVMWVNERILKELGEAKKTGQKLKSEEIETFAHEFTHIIQSRHIMEKYRTRAERATAMRAEQVNRIMNSTEEEYVQYVLEREKEAETVAQAVSAELLSS